MIPLSLHWRPHAPKAARPGPVYMFICLGIGGIQCHDARLNSASQRWLFISRAEKETHMSFLAWIVLGLIAGFIGSKIVNKSGEGLIVDILLGIVGAVVGGWLFNRFG